MDTLIAGGEITLGVALFVGLTLLVATLRPRGTVEPRAIVNFPAAWIIIGLPLTFGFALSIALILIGLRVLR